MRLIQNDMLIGYLLQDVEIVDEEFIVGQQDLKFGDFGWDDVSCLGCMHVIELIFLDDLPDLWRSLVVVEETVEGSPLLDLPAPLVESGKWGEDEKRA